MQILKALRKEEDKFLKEISVAQQQLDTVRQAIKLMAGKAIGKVRKRRKMSATTRKKMAASARKRWAAKKEQ